MSSRLRSFVDVDDVLKAIYFAHLQSYMSYRIIKLYVHFNSVKLLLLQKRAVRAVFIIVVGLIVSLCLRN